MTRTDRELGMNREITRRDFLNGASVAIGGSMLAPSGARATSPSLRGETGASSQSVTVPQSSRHYYPPRLTGMRGSREGSFEVAHDMRDGKSWGAAEATGELYDLIVVGGGLSGLAAAYYYRKALPEAKILILDNHDDFGGHAKRNEFEVDGRLVIGYGGTMFITGAYTPEGQSLLEDIGLDAERFHRTTEPMFSLYERLGLGSAVFFDRETFGTDRLVVGTPDNGWGSAAPTTQTWGQFLAKTPLSDTAKRGIERLYEDQRDYMPGLTVEEKITRLRKMSYQDYLLNVVKVQPDVIPYFLRGGDSNSAAGIDTYSAMGAFRSGWLPGMEGLGLQRPARSWLGDADNPLEGIHFPDGNAGIARLIVRWLIPGSLPGQTMEDSVTTPVWYAALDRPSNDVRIRLNSTVVNAKHKGDRRTAKEVEVTYVRDNKAYRVRAGGVVMACYNSVLPYLCPELPAEQKDALRLAVRKPYVYTNVVLSNWRAFYELGVSNINCPGGYYGSILLDWNVSLGDYQSPATPDDPMVLHLQRVPTKPGLPARDQFRAGREELLITPFETFERNTRDQLGRALADAGFDPAEDIRAITVNRWPHGYAGGHNELYDPDWSYDEVPWVVGRQRFGRITVANSDAAAVSLTSAAFDQGHRAVQELLTDVVRPEFQYPWVERT